jgi:hypothetical protein
MASKPNPGSPEAVAAGCKCPVLDNSHGKGAFGGMLVIDGEPAFYIAGNCPMHPLPDEEDE